jgi:hypothetical protein
LSSSDLLQLITSCLNLGVLGLVFWLFVGGKLHASQRDGPGNRGARSVAQGFRGKRPMSDASRRWSVRTEVSALPPSRTPGRVAKVFDVTGVGDQQRWRVPRVRTGCLLPGLTARQRAEQERAAPLGLLC